MKHTVVFKYTVRTKYMYSRGSDPFEQCFDEQGNWRTPPQSWHCQTPDQLLQQQDLTDCILKFIDALPANQKLVLQLRDIQLFDLDEISNILELTPVNTRVLLHRARLDLFRQIDHYQETGKC